ncbi:MAG: type III toxin-antitoxin system ToxN/AbiQ family toxin [Christensenellaceae bacterium]|jgi:protein AbiQ|nr:type III toxin-antitoxin system ToxN/AbiQ family toxin [Christensenellaceae bacterium]
MVKLVTIDEKYIKYLSKFDSRVAVNKNQKRPYIGVLFEVRGHPYYAPLSSPKPKHTTMRNTEDFMRIAGGKYGAINFNNMIPVVLPAIHEIDISAATPIGYKMVLIHQIEFFNEKETEIINKATKLYKNYKSGKIRKEVKDRCCNFFVLEKKIGKYDPNYLPKPKV